MMNYCKRLFAKITILFIFIGYYGYSQRFILNEKEQRFNLPIKGWEFFTQDDSTIKSASFPNSKILSNTIFFYHDSINPADFKEVVWFRKKIVLDSSINNIALSLQVEIIGAAEVYINQKFIKKFGSVSRVEQSETIIGTDLQWISYPFLPNQEYIIAIRYSNHQIQTSHDDSCSRAFGLKINFVETNSLLESIFLKIKVSLKYQ